MASQSQSLSPGTILHGKSYNYIIQRALGQGTFGITYLAKVQMIGSLGALDSNITVAIKEFFMHDVNGRNGSTVTSGSKQGVVQNYRIKFKREANNLSKLSHPNIVKVLEEFDANETSYFVMEYIEGCSLDAAIRDAHAFPEKRAIPIFLQICSAVNFMHSNHMLHLDIKPGNIMLRKSSDAVLIDFGLSKQYDETGEPESSTNVGAGTAGYAPMEQGTYREGKNFPVTMDVYALGGTLFKMLTGERPPEASIIFNDGFPREELERYHVSPEIIDVVEQAMAPSVRKRIPDVWSLITQLVECKVDETESSEWEYFHAQENQDEDSESSESSEKEDHSERSGVEDFDSQESQNSEPTFIGQSSHQENTSPIKSTEPWACCFLSLIGTICSILIIISVFLSKNSTWILIREISIFLLFAVFIVNIIYWLIDRFTNNRKVFTIRGVTFKMMKVEGGTFRMGATLEQENPDNDEKPVHEVSLSTYYIGETVVTQALWKAVMGTVSTGGPSKSTGDNLPLENVSWEDCQDFICKLNSITGENFRLPTEEEWEFAARGGKNSRGYQYAGSNNLKDVAWYNKISNGATHNVKTKKPNELGIYDMSGNVWEWCHDWYYPDRYFGEPSSTRTGRVIRGGSCNSDAWNCRLARRRTYLPEFQRVTVGLRLAL